MRGVCPAVVRLLRFTLLLTVWVVLNIFWLFRRTKAHIRSIVGEPASWQGRSAVGARLCLCILHDKAGSRAAGRREGFHNGKMLQKQKGRAETSAQVLQKRVKGSLRIRISIGTRAVRSKIDIGYPS